MDGIVFPTMTGQEEAQAVVKTETDAVAAEGEAPRAGTAHYAVAMPWFSAWCRYSGFTYDARRRRAEVVAQQEPGPRPGPVDNTPLLGQHPSTSDLTEEQRQQGGVVHLRDGLVDRQTVWVLSEPTWNLLKSWYGCTGPEVRREYHVAGGRPQIDLAQQHFRVVVHLPGGGEREAVVGASSLCKVQELKGMACAALGGLDAEDYELFDYVGLQRRDCLEAVSYKTLPGAKLRDQQALLLEPRGQPAPAPAAARPLALPSSGSGGYSPLLSPLRSPLRASPRFGGGPTSPMSPLSRSFDRAPAWAEDSVSEVSGRAHGLGGLGNLGNTCFMNSSLQCLAHTPHLMRVFLSGSYQAALNRDNPLSLGGKLALAFGALMAKLWQGGVGSVSPKLFKWQLARFAPQFSGYAQQDSQELLAFLLDGLHEDLNRITDKPYIEDRDSDGRPDEEVAAEAWANYRRRNDSVVVDAFQGLYRSLLSCPSCGNRSVKFDPLMYLTLPLPSSKMRALTFTVVHVDGAQAPQQYGLELPRAASMAQLYAAVAQLAGVGLAPGEAPQDRLLLTQTSLSSGDTAVYADLKARVSSVEDLRARFSYQRASPTYVCYVYPSAAEGPRAPGARPVLLHHKYAGNHALPLMPLFVPGGDALAAELTPAEPADIYELVVHHPRVAAALKTLLRPCSKVPEEAPAPAAPEEAAAGGSGAGGGSPVAMDEAPPSAAPAAAAAAEAEAALADGEAMDVEEPAEQQQQAQQQQQEQQAGAAPAPAGGQDEDWMDALDRAAPITEDAPLDLWAEQNWEVAEAKAKAAAAAAGQPLYSLKLAKPSTYGSGGYTLSGVRLEEALAEDCSEPLILVAEWSDAWRDRYSADPLLRPPQHASAAELAERRREGGKGVTLADCLESFLQPEQLDAEDSWYCGKCKQHVQADKKLDLWSLPEVLVIHLKRFSYSRYSRDKLDTLVDFPLTGLDMGPYLLPRQQGAAQQGDGSAAQGTTAAVQQQQQQPPPVYDLYAVSNHYGGMGGGHYTAYARCRVPGTADAEAEGGGGAEAGAGPCADLGHWHTFDDSHVSRMQASGVCTSAAYVLFYRRRGSPAVDVPALLEQRAAELAEARGAGGFGAAQPAAGGEGGDASMLDSPLALAAASQAAGEAGTPPPPPPLPMSSGGSLGSALGKRQPETIDEEVEEEDDGAGAMAAGSLELD